MEYNKLTVGEFCDSLEEFSSYKLLMHSSPDGDTFGSCMALSYILADMGKSTYIIYPDEKFPEYLREFATCEVYSAEQGEAIMTDGIMTVDVAAPNQLRGNYDRYKDSINLMLDHHNSGAAMADNLIVPSASAVGEIVFDIAEELVARGRIKELRREAADALFLSITSDTGCFKYQNATSKTHIIAARLLEMGVDGARINALCFDTKTPEQIEAEKITYNNLRILLDGKLCIAALDKNTKAGIANEYFENAVNIARSVKGAIVSCSIKEKDIQPQSFRISLRSLPGTVDVSAISAEFGGGGHVCAAGCAIDAPDIDTVVEIITKRIAEVL